MVVVPVELGIQELLSFWDHLHVGVSGGDSFIASASSKTALPLPGEFGWS